MLDGRSWRLETNGNSLASNFQSPISNLQPPTSNSKIAESGLEHQPVELAHVADGVGIGGSAGQPAGVEAERHRDTEAVAPGGGGGVGAGGAFAEALGLVEGGEGQVHMAAVQGQLAQATGGEGSPAQLAQGRVGSVNTSF